MEQQIDEGYTCRLNAVLESELDEQIEEYTKIDWWLFILLSRMAIMIYSAEQAGPKHPTGSSVNNKKEDDQRLVNYRYRCNGNALRKLLNWDTVWFYEICRLHFHLKRGGSAD